MKSKKNENIINIIENVSNGIDPRLINHGKRVAYMVYRVLKPRNLLDKKELHEMCVLALLHDIGAYKTEEIDKMLIFETTDVWRHSIYGYIFLKYFSPLKDWAPIILCHHGERKLVEKFLDSKYQLLTQIISLCDKADIYYMQDDSCSQKISFATNQWRGVQYSDEVVNMYLEANIDLDTISDEMLNDEEFNKVLYDDSISKETTNHYLQMIFQLVNFKNDYKLHQTFLTKNIPATLRRLSKLSKSEIERVKEDRFTYSLEEIGVPKRYLRRFKLLGFKPGKLDKRAFLNDILLISKVLAFFYKTKRWKDYCPKRKVIDILSDLFIQQDLHPCRVALAMEQHDSIVKETGKEKLCIFEIYNNIETIAKG